MEPSASSTAVAVMVVALPTFTGTSPVGSVIATPVGATLGLTTLLTDALVARLPAVSVAIAVRA